MADEKQEDMSMDEILSSIKDILSENDAPASAAPAPAQPAAPAAAPNTAAEKDDILDLPDSSVDFTGLTLAAEEQDDVLDLTPDMRLEPSADSQPADASEPESIDLGKELEAVALDINTSPADAVAEPDSDEPLPDFVAAGDSLDLTTAADSDPIFIPEEESAPLYQDLPASPAPELTAAAEVIHETEVEEILPSETETVNQNPEAEEPEQSGDAVDVSADIINNFAKIFAQSQGEEITTNNLERPAVKAAAITHDVVLGSGNQTLSEMVKEVIRDIISGWVMENLDTTMDLDQIAREQIGRQVKAWMDVNLPALVESIVKKEIERVMVKAAKK